MKKTKQILSVLLAVVMLLCAVPVFFLTSAVTTDELSSYVRGLVGSSAKEWGSGSGTQCVELPKYYLDNYFGLSTKYTAMGNGNEFYKNVASKFPDKFQRIDYYNGFVPSPGDIISFHSTSSPAYGHAAIVYSVSGNQYTIAEQWKGSGTVRSNTKTIAAGTYGKSYTIIGVARPYCDAPVPIASWNIENPDTYPSYPGYNLKTGVKDDYVRFIQTGLNAIGYGCGNADGIFGQKTFDAVWSWQEDNGLTADGIVGTATWGKLIERFKAKYQKLNLGNDFYAYIILKSAWRHLEASNDNVQIAVNGNNCFDPKQVWHFLRQSNGSYKIINEFAGKCLDLYNSNTAQGTNIQTWPDNNCDAQRWFIFSCGDGYGLRTACGDGVLDCTDGCTDAGTNIQIWNPNATSAQIFSVYDVRNDGIEYNKPVKPSSSSITSIEKNGSKVKIIWSVSNTVNKYDNRTYDLRVWQGTGKSEHSYKYALGLTGNSYEIELPDGTYTANITTVNTKYNEWYTTGATKTFTVSSHVHSYTPTITKPATCSATGIKTFTCSCGASYTETIAVNASNHVNTKNISATPSTCTVKGYTAGVYCNDCKKYISGHAEQPLAPHQTTLVNAKDATYDAEGYTGDTYCTVCKQTLTKGSVIPKLTKPDDPTNPTNPTQPQPTQPQQQPSGSCKYCGGTHTGFPGILIGFFHSILALFGLRK